jgi:endonuclease/exonuclease/phosphatase family metal-dependent hydrolase
MNLKVMCYNVLHGFHNDASPFEFQPDRLEAAKRVVREYDPDILVITEACYGQEFKGSFIDYQKEFAFPHHFHAHKNNEHGVSLLSRFPITGANYSAGRMHFLRAGLGIEGKIINFDVVHPHPSLSEEEKARFMESVLRDHARPYILAGDLNACSPRDKYKRDDMIRSFSRFIPNHAVETVDGLLSFKAIPRIEIAKLIDTYKAIHPDEDAVNYTVPTNLRGEDKGSGMRCDFIFCSDDFTVEDAGVIKTTDTEMASDHHPINATLILKNK